MTKLMTFIVALLLIFILPPWLAMIAAFIIGFIATPIGNKRGGDKHE